MAWGGDVYSHDTNNEKQLCHDSDSVLRHGESKAKKEQGFRSTFHILLPFLAFRRVLPTWVPPTFRTGMGCLSLPLLICNVEVIACTCRLLGVKWIIYSKAFRVPPGRERAFRSSSMTFSLSHLLIKSQFLWRKRWVFVFSLDDWLN